MLYYFVNNLNRGYFEEKLFDRLIIANITELLQKRTIKFVLNWK